MPTALRLTAVQVGLAALLSVASLALVVAVRPSVEYVVGWVITVVAAAAILALALVVARRAPTNRCGPLMALVGLMVVVLSGTDEYLLAAATDPSLPLSPYVVAFTQGTWMAFYVPLALLMLFFPTGHLLGPRWSVVVVGLIAVPIVFTGATAFTRAPYMEPFGDRPRVVTGSLAGDIVSGAMLLPFLALLISSAASLFLRYRRGDQTERLQLRWMAVAAMTIPDIRMPPTTPTTGPGWPPSCGPLTPPRDRAALPAH